MQTTTYPEITPDMTITLATSDGQFYAAVPVLERRRAGLRLGVRAGFGPTDVFVPYAKITTIDTI